MGLTIHANIQYQGKTPPTVLVEQMRQLAMDLPFEEVSEIIDLSGAKADFNNYKASKNNEDIRWKLIQAQQTVRCSWNAHRSRRVSPERVIVFSAWPGWGSESLNLGLACYPKTIDWEYSPVDDQQFLADFKEGSITRMDTIFLFDKFKKYRDRLAKRRGGYFQLSAEADVYKETCHVPTKLKGWSWKSFCKTQYASKPDCGGMPNFLKCHISAITLLERIGNIPKLTVDISDEGHYGSANYSDDWKEAQATGRQPTYVPHEATHNVKTLIEQCGDYNELVAGFAGALKDAIGSEHKLESPIFEYQNFEELEFRAHQNEDLNQFLQVMDIMAKQNRPEKTNDD